MSLDSNLYEKSIKILTDLISFKTISGKDNGALIDYCDEILKKLGKTFSNPKPPTAYRAIEFWKQHNFIHRIERINAYTICDADNLHNNGTQFLICSSCCDVTESHICDLPKAIQNAINEKLFELKSWNLEMNGVCKKCN